MKKIRVLEFAYNLGFGGTEKTLYTFCKYLDKDAFDVHACAFASDEESGCLEKIRATGVPVTISSPRFFEQYLKKIKPDIIHIHRGGWAEEGVITTARKVGVPIVIEHNVFGRLDTSPEDAHIDCHILISYTCGWRYQMFRKEPLTGSRFEILYYPIEIDPFDQFGFDDRDYSRKIIGRMGRNDIQKWDLNYLSALPYIIERFPELEFRIVGVTDEVVEKLKQLGVAKNVRVFPMTSDPNTLMQFYKDLSVFTHMCSTGETFGLVFAEAMAAKLPVVTHHVPQYQDNAQSEIVSSCVTGFVTNSPEEYAEAVIALLDSPKDAKRFGEAGYEKARLCFEAQKITHSLEDIFRTQMRLKGLL